MEPDYNSEPASPDIEPPTGAVPSPANVTEGPQPTGEVRSFTADVSEVRKKRRWPKVLAGSLVSILVLAGVGTGVFYSVYRTPNSEYDALLRDLRSMREDAKTIPIEGTVKVGEKNSTFNDETRHSSAKNYIDKLQKVKSSPVLKNDSSVQKSYENDKKVLEEYGESSLELLETATVVQKVSGRCDSAFENMSEVSTVKEFNALVLDCEQVMAENPHVSRKSFDEAYYVRLIAAYKGIISAYRPAYQAYEAKDSKKLEAMTGTLQASQNAYMSVTASKPTLSNTKNPTYILDDMIKTAEQRKTVFFRR